MLREIFPFKHLFDKLNVKETDHETGVALFLWILLLTIKSTRYLLGTFLLNLSVSGSIRKWSYMREEKELASRVFSINKYKWKDEKNPYYLQIKRDFKLKNLMRLSLVTEKSNT